jgi:hypothetical protein
MPNIENATIVPFYNNSGVHTRYRISPNDGYVLHDKRSDYTDFDEYGNETLVLGYIEGTVSVRADYDFVANPYELYAVLRSEVPENQIFGGVGNDHEVM